MKVDIQGKIERRVWRGGGMPSKVRSTVSTEKLVDEHKNEEWLQKKNEEWEVVKKKGRNKERLNWLNTFTAEKERRGMADHSDWED